MSMPTGICHALYTSYAAQCTIFTIHRTVYGVQCTPYTRPRISLYTVILGTVMVDDRYTLLNALPRNVSYVGLMYAFGVYIHCTVYNVFTVQ